MEHPITERHWMEYLHGGLPDPERRLVESHLRTCVPCRKTLDDLQHWESRLTSSFAEFGDRITPSPSYAETLLERTLSALRDSAAESKINVQEALTHLRAALTRIFGPGIAERTMRFAAIQAAGRDLESLTSEDWDDFVANLRLAAASLFGDTAGQLVNKAAESVTEELP